jgi:hypothetical protein
MSKPEDIVFEPKSLDAQGRCCGRKPIHYKTRNGFQRVKDPHFFCVCCAAEFDMDGAQRPNWAYRKSADDGFIPTYPNSEHGTAIRKRGEG